VATKVGKSGFRVSNTLLESFRKIHQIVFYVVCDEGGSVARLQYLYKAKPVHNGQNSGTLWFCCRRVSLYYEEKDLK